MRGAHDNGSHGSKCLMGLRPGKRRDCGNGAESRGLAAADSREAEPQREASYELSRDDQRAGNDHERREDTQKSPFAFSSQFFGSDHDGYQDQSDGQRHQGQRKQRFLHGVSSRTLWFRCFDVRFFCAY